MRGLPLPVLALLPILALAGCAPEPQPTTPAVVVLPVATTPGSSAVAVAPLAPAESPLELPGVDTHRLDGRERAEWTGLVHQLLAPCPSVAVPLDQCVLDRRDCRACAPAAAWVARAVLDGKGEAEVIKAYAARFDPADVKTLPLDGSPMMGAASGPVTIVEFVDLECPHCRRVASELDKVLASYPRQVRLVYKSYPLTSHLHAEAAARAAVAAGRQGKFWQMERALLEGQEHLEARDLEAQARALKLDLPRWRADMASTSVVAKVAEDRTLGDDLRITGTPAIYVNGRVVDGDGETLEERVREEAEGQ
jgi:protein-disulfide isomerase